MEIQRMTGLLIHPRSKLLVRRLVLDRALYLIAHLCKVPYGISRDSTNFLASRKLSSLIALVLWCNDLASRGWAEPIVTPTSSPRAFNVVIVLADDLGYGDIGCYGARDIPTPHIDLLASEGTRFTDFYVSQPVCTASRASLLTGCYAQRVGLEGALNHTSVHGIHNQEYLLSELFHDSGYVTGVFGKWHLGMQPQFLPTRHGFDEFLGIPYSNDNGPLHPVIRGIPPLPLLAGERVISHDPDQHLWTQWITESACQFIERHRDKPFFLYVAHIMPHVPIFCRPAFRGKSQRGLYGDVVSELDWSVGEIRATLRRVGLTDKTWFIFLSDNGPFLSYGDHAGSAYPLREGKLTTFEGGVRVPCLMTWPGVIPAAHVCTDMITAMDLWPTCARLLHAALPSHPIDGVDMWDVITAKPGASNPRRHFFYYSGRELHAVREGVWKLHVSHDYLTPLEPRGRDGKPAGYGHLQPLSITDSGIRGIASRHGYAVKSLPLSLYNLNEDPGESRNVAEEHPMIVQRLMQLILGAREELGDSLTGHPGKLRSPGRLEAPHD
ncbi:MAG: arylsulfatase [Planctomycetaceae bacterium]|nr:MAG: arylsulfatase [Planctomycetaceae bacterium]